MNHYICKALYLNDLYNIFTWIKEIYSLNDFDFNKIKITTVENEIECEIESDMSYNNWIDIFIEAEKNGIKNMKIIYETFAPMEMYTSEKLYLFYDTD